MYTKMIRYYKHTEEFSPYLAPWWVSSVIAWALWKIGVVYHGFPCPFMVYHGIPCPLVVCPLWSTMDSLVPLWSTMDSLDLASLPQDRWLEVETVAFFYCLSKMCLGTTKIQQDWHAWLSDLFVTKKSLSLRNSPPLILYYYVRCVCVRSWCTHVHRNVCVCVFERERELTMHPCA